MRRLAAWNALAAMGPFDYLTVLVSVVLGLAVANILARLAAVITARERIDFYWPPVAWGIWLFFISVQHWWAQWGLRHTERWTFPDFWLMLLTPVDLYLLSAVILPQGEDGESIDLAEWYTRNRAWFFSLLLFLPALSILEEIVRSGRMSSTVNLVFLIVFEVVIVFALMLKSRRVHEWITGQAMVLTLVYVGLLFLRLPG